MVEGVGQSLKTAKIFYYTGLSLSLLVGLWHFFVPAMFQWYRYIPGQYENLIVGIDWTNFCFSLLLSGLSLLLLLLGKKTFSGNKEVILFYGFLALVWLGRVAISFIKPWPLDPIPWVAFGQQAGAICILVCLLVPLVYVLVRLRIQGRGVKP